MLCDFWTRLIASSNDDALGTYLSPHGLNSISHGGTNGMAWRWSWHFPPIILLTYFNIRISFLMGVTTWFWFAALFSGVDEFYWGFWDILMVTLQVLMASLV